MAVLKLTQGYQAVVDDEDLPRLLRYRWQANHKGKNVYASRYQRLKTCRYRTRYLHYEVLNLPQPLPHPLCIDHINRNSLDCRKQNLRVCSRLQNAHNIGPSSAGKTSKYKGISYRPDRRKWLAKIRVNYKRYNLGSFETEYQAVQAYNHAARQHHGRFAYINQWTGPPNKKTKTKNATPTITRKKNTKPNSSFHSNANLKRWGRILTQHLYGLAPRPVPGGHKIHRRKASGGMDKLVFPC